MANEQLLNYIKQARQSGKNDEQIRQELLSSGWQGGDIDEALKIKPTISKSFKFPVLILVVLGIAVAGYFAGAYYFTLWPFEAFAPIPTFTPRPSSTLPPIQSNQLEGWKTYADNKYGFEFKYPGDWKYTIFNGDVELNSPATELEQKTSVETPTDIVLGIEDNTKKVSLGNFAKQTDDGWFELYKSKEQILIDGHQAIYYKDIYNNPGAVGSAPVAAVFIEGNSYFLIFTLGGYENKETAYKLDVLNKILSTFKFTGPTQAPVKGIIYDDNSGNIYRRYFTGREEKITKFPGDGYTISSDNGDKITYFLVVS